MKIVTTTLASLCLLAGSATATASSFMEYCQDANTSKAGKLALKLIADMAKSPDCSEMEKYLKTGDSVVLSDDNLTEIKALSFFPNLTRVWVGSEKTIDLSQLGSDTAIESLVVEAPIKALPVIGKELDNLTINGAPNVDLSNLAKYPKLEDVNLSESPLASYAQLSAATTLKHLRIEWGNLANIKQIAQLKNIEWLYLPHNDLDSIAGIEGMAKLEGLDIEGNHVKDLSPVAKLAELRILEISDNPIRDFSSLSGLKNLESLNLAGMEISDLAFVTSLPAAITSLDLDRNEISDVSPLTKMPSLTHIDISHNLIRDIAPLGKMEKLEGITADQNYITALPEISKNLRGLYLENNLITNFEGIHVAAKTKLKQLNLRHNNLQDLEGISLLRNLTYLDIANNKVQSLAHLRDLNKLRMLQASDNRIYDIGAIAYLNDLEVVYLDRNNVSSVAPLKDSNIEHLMIDDNPLGYKYKRYESNCPKKARSKGVRSWCSRPIERNKGGGFIGGGSVVIEGKN